jgi:hypothetical protein
MLRYVSPKRRLTFNRLHGAISQKIELFINTVVRTSESTKEYGDLTHAVNVKYILIMYYLIESSGHWYVVDV